MNIKLIIILATLLHSAACKYDLPVFLLDFDQVMNSLNTNTDPFYAVTASQFAEIVKNSIDLSEIVVIFVEENFSQEDLSTKDNLGTPYEFLRQNLKFGKVKYFPSVSQPYRVLKEMLRPQPFNIFYLSASYNTPQIMIHRFKYFYISFKDDLNDTRVSTLRKHDRIMREVYIMIKQQTNRPVVGFYTGKNNPIVINTKPMPPIEINVKEKFVHRGVTVPSKRGLFHFKGVTSSTPSRRSYLNHAPIVSNETWTPESLSTTLAYSDDLQLHFNFTLTDRHWSLESVAWLVNHKEVGRTKLDLSVRWGRSYVCAEPIHIINKKDGSVLSISHYQIEPYQDPPAADETTPSPTDPASPANTSASANPDAPAGVGDQNKFHMAEECVPYFTAGIISCLFITFICLFVLFVGIVFMMDIGTNDRYDDFGKVVSFGGDS